MFEESKHLLFHYISLCMKESGLKVDSDTKAEIEDIFNSMENDIRKIVQDEISKTTNKNITKINIEIESETGNILPEVKKEIEDIFTELIVEYGIIIRKFEFEK